MNSIFCFVQFAVLAAGHGIRTELVQEDELIFGQSAAAEAALRQRSAAAVRSGMHQGTFNQNRAALRQFVIKPASTSSGYACDVGFSAPLSQPPRKKKSSSVLEISSDSMVEVDTEVEAEAEPTQAAAAPTKAAADAEAAPTSGATPTEAATGATAAPGDAATPTPTAEGIDKVQFAKDVLKDLSPLKDCPALKNRAMRSACEWLNNPSIGPYSLASIGVKVDLTEGRITGHGMSQLQLNILSMILVLDCVFHLYV